MAQDALENPVWSSLCGRHSAFADGGPELKMYPPEMAPFAAVPYEGPLSGDLLEATLGTREFVYFVGTLPHVESGRHTVTRHDNILQMVCKGLRPAPVAARVSIEPLEASNVDAMLDLMGRVYPAYFRRRTIEMGRYAGIFDGAELVAMAGLRLAPAGYREISGVCTDPRFAGRGYAGALVHHLAAAVSDEGDTPMLHQDLTNTRARELYEALGFAVSREVPMCRVSRANS